MATQHNYINPAVLKKFTDKDLLQENSADIIYEHLETVQFSNVSENFEIEELALVLANDFAESRCNYRAFIEHGMDLRLFMELRKSALLYVTDDIFFSEHAELQTAQEVKDYRTQYFLQWYADYADLDWQYWFLLTMSLTRKQKVGLCFDYEDWFADADPEHKFCDDYAMKFMERFIEYRRERGLISDDFGKF